MAPADVPDMPSISSHGSCKNRSRPPQVNAPWAPPPWSARSTRIGSRMRLRDPHLLRQGISMPGDAFVVQLNEARPTTVWRGHCGFHVSDSNLVSVDRPHLAKPRPL